MGRGFQTRAAPAPPDDERISAEVAEVNDGLHPEMPGDPSATLRPPKPRILDRGFHDEELTPDTVEVPALPPVVARRRRPLFGCASTAIGIVGLSLLTGAMGALWLSTAAGQAFLEQQVEYGVSGLLTSGRLEVGHLAVGWRGIRIDDLTLVDASGKQLVGVGRLAADFDPWHLVRGVVHLPRLRAEGVSVDLTADESGVLDIVRLFGGPSTDPGGGFALPVPVSLLDVDLRSVSVRYRPANGAGIELSGVDLQGAINGAGDHVALTGLVAAGQLARPGPLALVLTGDVVYDGKAGLLLDGISVTVPHGTATVHGAVGDHVNLSVALPRLEARALDPFFGDAGIGGVWQAGFTARGPADRVDLALSLTGIERSAGNIQLAGVLDRTGASYAATVEVDLTEFHVEHLFTPLTAPIVVGGHLSAAGSGSSLEDLAVTGTLTGAHQSVMGFDLDRLGGAFALDGGQLGPTLSLTGLEVEGIVGKATVDGSIAPAGPLDLRVRGTLDPDHLAKLGAIGLDGNGTFDVNVTMDLVAQTPISIQGQVRYAPFVYPNVRIAELIAPLKLEVIGSKVLGTVDLSGTGLDANGLTAAKLGAQGLELHVEDGVTTVEGPVLIDGVAFAPWITADSANASISFRMDSKTGDKALDALVGIMGYTLAQRPGTDGTVSLFLVNDDLSYNVDMLDSGRSVLDVDGSYNLTTAAVALDHVAFAPTPRTTWTNPAPASLRVVAGGAEALDLRLESALGTVTATGRLGTEGLLAGNVSVSAFQLDHLAELYPERVGDLSGTLDLALALSGDAANPQIDGGVDLRRLFAGGSVRWLDAVGTFALEDGRLKPDIDLGVAGSPFAVLDGTMGVSGGLASLAPNAAAPIDLSLAIVPGSLERLRHAFPSLDESVARDAFPQGRLSAHVTVGQTLGDPVLRLAGVSEVQVAGWEEPGRVEFDIERRGKALSVAADLREGLQSRAIIHGGGATRIGDMVAAALGTASTVTPAVDFADKQAYIDDMSISTVLVGVPVASLATLADSAVAFGGELVGGFVLTGSPDRPVVDGGVNWLDPMVGTQHLDGAYLALVPSDDGYVLDTALHLADGGALTVNGTLPMQVDLAKTADAWFTDSLALQVGGPGIPLSLLSAFDPQMRDGKGLLAVSGQIGGTPRAPELDVTATLTDGAFTYDSLGITAEQIGLSVEFKGKMVRMHEANAVLLPAQRFRAAGLPDGEKPRVTATGSARLDGWVPSALAARVLFTGGPWLAAREDMTVRSNGEITIGGAWPALTARGNLDVVHGRIVLDPAELLGNTPLEVAPNLLIVRTDTPQARVVADTPSPYADFDVDIDIDLKRNLELSLTMPFVDDLGSFGAAVTSVDLSTRLGGAVNFGMEAGEPSVVGAVELLEGKVRMMNSAFDLQEGTITFSGGDPFEDATLDLKARMTVTGATLDLSIAGTRSEPEIALSSDEYPDRTEQMTILLTGRAPDELTADQGAGAAQALADVLFSSVLAGQSLGTLSIEPDGTARLGVPLSSSVYATSSLTPTPGPNENSLALQVEWSLAPRVLLSGGAGDRVQWGDLYWEVRF